MSTMRNKVQLIGHLGADPEIIEMGNDRKLAKIKLATNESYKNANGERVTDTQWHQVVAWGKLAGLAEKLLVKGSEVAVEGKLIHKSYTDKQGVKRYTSEVQISDLILLKKKD